MNLSRYYVKQLDGLKMPEQLTLWADEPQPDIYLINEPRCEHCAVLLNEASMKIGFCTSECEREASQQ